jgi:hypothetical protein
MNFIAPLAALTPLARLAVRDPNGPAVAVLLVMSLPAGIANAVLEAFFVLSYAFVVTEELVPRLLQTEAFVARSDPAHPSAVHSVDRAALLHLVSFAPSVAFAPNVS